MSELTDLNATGNGLSAVSGGLQGLLEAYKMKMAQNVEQAKITQSGLDAGAAARMMMPYRLDTLNERIKHDRATEENSAATSSGIDPAMIQNHIQGVLNGSDSLSRIGSTLNPRARTQTLNSIQAGVLAQNPQFDFGASERDYKARMATAGLGFQQRQAGVEEIMTPGGLMDQYREAIKNSGISKYPIANKIKGLYKSQVDDPAIQNVINKANAIAEAGQGMVGAGSDAKLANFQAMLGNMKNGMMPGPDTLNSGADTMSTFMNSRKASFGQQLGYGRSAQYAPAPGIHPVLAAVLPSAAPAPVAGPRYSDPNKAAQIAAAYKSGPQTPEAYAATQQQLDALAVGQ